MGNFKLLLGFLTSKPLNDPVIAGKIVLIHTCSHFLSNFSRASP